MSSMVDCTLSNINLPLILWVITVFELTKTTK